MSKDAEQSTGETVTVAVSPNSKLTKIRLSLTGIRVLSLLALVLLLVIINVAGLLVLTNAGLTLMYLLGFAGLGVGSWLLLSSKGRRFLIGLVAAVMSLIVILIVTLLFFSERKNRLWLLTLIVASILYLALTGFITNTFWRTVQERQPGGATRYKRKVLVVNPKSGNGRAIKAHIPELAQSAGITVHVLKPGQDLRQLLEDAVADGADVLGISGGDGTLGLAAEIAIDHDLPLVVLPGGTRCHFARDLGLNPNRITDAFESFKGIERRVDVGQIGDRYFLNNASFGLYAEITDRPEYRQHKAATTRKVMHDLATREAPFYPLVFQDNHGATWNHAALVLIGVNRYQTLHLGELGQRKRLDEGVLQIIAIPALSSTILKDLVRHHEVHDLESVSEWTTSNITISHRSGRIKVGLDGENVSLPAPVKIRVRPLALRLLVPAEGPRGRPIKPFSAEAARTLWNFITAGRGEVPIKQ